MPDPFIPFTGKWTALIMDTDDALFQVRSVGITCRCGSSIGLSWIAPIMLATFYASMALTVFCPTCGALYSIFQGKDCVEDVRTIDSNAIQ